jgi:hypothetical protein
MKRSIAMNAMVGVAVGAVTIVLFLGLFNMLRGGSANKSQQLMRWRVGLQFLAVVIMMAVIWYKNR